jgi:hypothetical protein
MFRDIPKVVAHHYKEGNLNYPMIIYISLVHIVAVLGLFALPRCSKETLVFAFTLWPIRYVALQACICENCCQYEYLSHTNLSLVSFTVAWVLQ